MVTVAEQPFHVLCRCGLPIAMSPITSEPVCCLNCGRGLRWEDGILLLGDVSNQQDYPDDSYAFLAGIEPQHFWFSSRNKLIIAMMRRYIGPLGGRSVLDVGCGTGYVLAALERSGMSVCGLDMHLAGLRYARRRISGMLLCETATRVPFRSEFDAVMLCDVIEHVPNDAAVIQEASQALKPGGSLVITVPAAPSLWTELDDVSGHKRRYTRPLLQQAIHRAGLSLVTLRYFNILLFPLQVLQRQILNRRVSTKASDRQQVFEQYFRVPPPMLNSLFHVAMSLDIPLSRIPVPFGASLIAIATTT
jgi:SAM-dependent methyltransferase